MLFAATTLFAQTPDTPPQNPNPPQASNQQPNSSVTIHAIPRLDVKRDWMDGASLIVGILLVVVGAVTGRLIWYQAKKTAEAAEATQRATEVIKGQTAILKESVAATEKSAEAARLNAQAVINAERAWIVVSVESPAANQFIFKATNVGKTAARIISIWADMAIVERGKEFQVADGYDKGESLVSTPPCLLPPTGYCTALWNNTEELSRNSPEVWSRYERGFSTMFSYGRIVYFDTVETEPRTPHETKWLYWHFPIEGALPIPYHLRPEYNSST